jgi:hypothetical protein
MTKVLDKKLRIIESALSKIRDGREGWLTRLDTDLTVEEYNVIEVSLEIAAGVCHEAIRIKEEG